MDTLFLNHGNSAKATQCHIEEEGDKKAIFGSHLLLMISKQAKEDCAGGKGQNERIDKDDADAVSEDP